LMTITDNTLSFPSIVGQQTFGFLRVTSGGAPGVASSVVLNAGTLGSDLWSSLNPPTGGELLNPGVGNPGEDAGVQNDPVNSPTERERLLTHIIFSPVLKSANRTLTVTYTLTISVARTQKLNKLQHNEKGAKWPLFLSIGLLSDYSAAFGLARDVRFFGAGAGAAS